MKVLKKRQLYGVSYGDVCHHQVAVGSFEEISWQAAADCCGWSEEKSKQCSNAKPTFDYATFHAESLTTETNETAS